MQPYDGRLVRIDSEEERQELADEGFEHVPQELNRAARRKLAGNKEAQVSLTSGGKLSKWAAKTRKARRKLVQGSKRKNRG